MGPEAAGELFTIGSTIKSQTTNLYLNIGTGSSSYLPLSLDATATTTAWGLEGDTIITANGSKYGRRKCLDSDLTPRRTKRNLELNFLVCNSVTSGYYDLFLQVSHFSDTISIWKVTGLNFSKVFLRKEIGCLDISNSI